MKKVTLSAVVSLLLLLTGAAVVVAGFFPPRTNSPYDLAGFARLPVQFGTRVLPIDSVARNTLRVFSTRTQLSIPDLNSAVPGTKIELPALQWFLDVAFRPENAERVPIFRIDNDETLGLIGQKQQGSQYFSFLDLAPHFEDIQKAADAADKKKDDEETLSIFDGEVQQLRDNLQLFQQLAVSFVPPGAEPAKDLVLWQSSLKPGQDAIAAEEAGKPFDQSVFDSFTLQAKRYMDMDANEIVGLLPADNIDAKWDSLGHGILSALHSGKVSPVLNHYADMGEALRGDDAAAFNAAVAALQKDLDVPGAAQKARFEAFLNQMEPFYRGSILYVMAFLCACVGWLAWGEDLRRAAIGLIGLGFALQLLGLAARVYLTGYAMVTSLYSSALFVGFIGVLAGLIIEFWFKRGIGAAVASAIGFVTLVIAHNLPFSGDDLARPQAVLATNLWLSTHVTCVTTGYGAMFVAGALGLGYIFYRSFVKNPDRGTLKLLAQLTYGVTCFATLFSFVGTMLGGIWADQSWGRFWGWDPKENGALLIVLWCAICLHARWGKLCTERGQAALAVFGNVVTAWSWFGVNLLGVGLHSYGFMQGTFVTLILFWLSQLLIIGLAYLPPRFWVRQVVVVAATERA
jgi:ABC-type transport system involved in cytochrome c biogenesis permease subunit